MTMLSREGWAAVLGIGLVLWALVLWRVWAVFDGRPERTRERIVRSAHRRAV